MMTVMQQLYLAGTNSMKDPFINDLTIPFRGLIQYTDRYNRARQLYTANKDKIKTIVSHSLGSVISNCSNPDGIARATGCNAL